MSPIVTTLRLAYERDMRKRRRGNTVGYCLTCGVGFIGMKNKLYCSGRCRQIASLQKRYFRQPATPPRRKTLHSGACAYCGKAFAGHGNRRYCSLKCKRRRQDEARREHNRIRSKHYRDADPERTRRQRLEQRRRHPEYASNWRRKNRDKTREYSRRYRERDREKYRKLLKKWDDENREKRRQISAAWRKAHPEKHAHLSARYRARSLGASGSHTFQQWLDLVARWFGKCAYCGRAGPLTRDHVVPLALGGTNDIDNILPACRRCNGRKRAMTADTFRALLATYPQKDSA